jgi:hypothetical protein
MATRSYIGKRLEDGKIRYIYCHFDGYPSHNGEILTEYYTTEDKVTDLLDLGDMSSLEPSLSECKVYDDGNVAIGDMSDFLDGNVSYYYLFENNEWQCFDYKGDQVTL